MGKFTEKFKIKISKRREDDFLWKEFLTRHLYSFLSHLHPKLHDATNTSLPYKIIDPALRIIGLPKGRAQYLDFLAEVPLKNGTRAPVLVHIEIQGDGGKHPFDKRMFGYYSRATIKHDLPVTAVALYSGTGEAPSGEFSQECFGTEVIYRYTSRSLSEFDEEELRRNDDPASLALLAALLSRKSKKDEPRKFSYLKELIKLLNERRYSEEDKIQLLLFLEGMIHLTDDDLIAEYANYTEEKEQEETPMYVSILEQYFTHKGEMKGEARGEARGISIGELKLKNTASQMLSDGVPIENIVRWTQLPEAEVLKLKKTKKTPPRRVEEPA